MPEKREIELIELIDKDRASNEPKLEKTPLEKKLGCQRAEAREWDRMLSGKWF